VGKMLCQGHSLFPGTLDLAILAKNQGFAQFWDFWSFLAIFAKFDQFFIFFSWIQAIAWIFLFIWSFGPF
jgi:hypothetical protein